MEYFFTVDLVLIGIVDDRPRQDKEVILHQSPEAISQGRNICCQSLVRVQESG